MVVVPRGKITFYIKLLALVLIVASCGRDGLSRLLDNDKGEFIDRKYHSETPLAYIINPQVYSSDEVDFQIQDSTSVQVYGSGELLYNFAYMKKEYYFLSDDIELFFKNPYNTSIQREITFSWGEAKGRAGQYFVPKNDSIGIYGFMKEDSLKRKKYFAEISIPFKFLGIDKPVPGTSILCDIAVGDTDDHFVQEGKISLFNTSEPLNNPERNYGQLFFSKNRNEASPLPSGYLRCIPGKAKLDWQVNDECWKSCPFREIRNIVSGFVKDKYDLSGKVSSCWTSDSLYFLLEIADGNQNRVFKKKLKDEQTFLDYGWIEDDQGNKVWEMNALHSQHAGGALKNHKVDTLVKLKKGKYKLKYISDESHAYNNWDDAPPSIPFYGIILYKEKD